MVSFSAIEKTETAMRIAFLGFGEAARAFHDTLAPRLGDGEFRAYDLLLDKVESADEMRAAMNSRNVAVANSPTELADADWIFSAVTADQSLDAARSILPRLGQGALLIDINSVSPQRKVETAALVGATGADYLDMAVMAPVHPRGHATPVLIAGKNAAVILDELLSLGFKGEIAGNAPGSATAIKMVRSVFVKGLEAITVEALLAAEASGCSKRFWLRSRRVFRAWSGRNFQHTSSSGLRVTGDDGPPRCVRVALHSMRSV
jgi:3-hydroxyisobutyrate dehydrogenase-like beta-hydroxyacid dehydrogenase